MQQSASTGRRPAATSSKKTVSAELRTLRLKEQLLTEELTVTEDLLKSIVADVGVPLDQTTVDDILEVTYRRQAYVPAHAAGRGRDDVHDASQIGVSIVAHFKQFRTVSQQNAFYTMFPDYLKQTMIELLVS